MHTERTPARGQVAAEIVVPGSISNLGPGFDALSVAVQLYLRARIVEVSALGARHDRVGVCRRRTDGREPDRVRVSSRPTARSASGARTSRAGAAATFRRRQVSGAARRPRSRACVFTRRLPSPRPTEDWLAMATRARGTPRQRGGGAARRSHRELPARRRRHHAAIVAVAGGDQARRRDPRAGIAHGACPAACCRPRYR